MLAEQLLAKFSITQWDVLIVGDGSGNAWNAACGWACVLIDRFTWNDYLFYGAMNAGSINLAESLPYFQSLAWYDETFGRTMLSSRNIINVSVVTDSNVVCTWGNRAKSLEECPRRLRTLWYAVTGLRQDGYNIKFHWLPRMVAEFNVVSDLVAGLCRKSLQQMDATQAANQAAIAQRAMLALSNVVLPTSAR